MFGFIRAMAVTPNIKVADCPGNAKNIIGGIFEAKKAGADIVVFPELSITSYTCGDLYLNSQLIESAEKQLIRIVEETATCDVVSVVGLPYMFEGKLYNCAAVIFEGKILGLVPKTYIPNYNEFYEKRHFEGAFSGIKEVFINGQTVPFSTKLLFENIENRNFVIGIEICEDLWSVIPPSSYHALAGATVIANLSGGNEITGKDVYRKNLVKFQSAALLCGYIYSCTGEGESTTDLVFSGHNIIAENGIVSAESERFKNGNIYCDIDVSLLVSERRKNTSFHSNSEGYKKVFFSMTKERNNLKRNVDPTPFVPSDISEREKRCDEIIKIQSLGLKKRIEHIGCKNVVIGISGGLDSTQALIVAAQAFNMAGLDEKGIIAVTMPSFGTTGRTYKNAVLLCKELGVTLLEINIENAVRQHFSDIEHSENVHNLTYENSQARERTQILMDLSNKYNGFVVGTGDLSELALGFATYNGDHMSMYGVNTSVPKTLIRYLIQYIADNPTEYFKTKNIRGVLLDILDTPVSPELLPPDDNGLIKQITEEIVGPYELHDFFLYNFVRMGYSPQKIYYLAKHAFLNSYKNEEILKWLKVFIKRFFSQQYKRSCMPDGPKVGSVSLSPRGDFRMPSDVCADLWLKELEEIEKSEFQKI